MKLKIKSIKRYSLRIQSFIKFRLLKSILFNDLERTNPVSRLFGFDRGTPIDRYYIESFLEMNKKSITGNVLEIADSTYSKKFGHEVNKYEVLCYDNSSLAATIIADLTRSETLPKNAIDCFICTQTLNYIYDVQEAVRGCYKILKEDGVLLCTVSGISQISRYDMDRWGDYWRFTNLSLKRMIGEVFGQDNVHITTYGNVLAATAFLHGIAVEDIPNISLLEMTDDDYQMTIGVKAIKKCPLSSNQ